MKDAAKSRKKNPAFKRGRLAADEGSALVAQVLKEEEDSRVRAAQWERKRLNFIRALLNAFAAALPRVMAVHNIKIHPDDVQVRVRKGRKRLEYDFVAPNGEVVLVGEVKTRLGLKDVVKLVGALRVFRRDYPEYARLKVYGVVAGGTVDNKALKQAQEEGFFVLRMSGGDVHPATGKGYAPTAY